MLVERQQDLHSSQKQRQKASVMEITAGRRECLETGRVCFWAHEFFKICCWSESHAC